MASHSWPEDDVIRLTALWNEQKVVGGRVVDAHSAEAIAQTLNRTKNSVVGKAHRLDLPGRESPIKYNKSNRIPADGAPTIPPAPKTTLAPLASTKTTLAPLASVADQPLHPPPVKRPERVILDIKTFAKPATAFLPKPVRRKDGSGCLYPFEMAGKSGFRYCDGDLSRNSTTYCDEHWELCRSKHKDREYA